MLLLTAMNVESIYAVITGTLGAIAFVAGGVGRYQQWNRNRNPWDLHFQVIQARDVQQHDTQKKNLEIVPGSYTIQVELLARVHTTLSAASIRTGAEREQVWKVIWTRVKHKQWGELSRVNIWLGVKLLLHLLPLNNPPDDCPLQIVEVRDATPMLAAHGTNLEPERGVGQSMWWLNYNPPYNIAAGRPIRLDLSVVANAAWRGYIEFSNDVEERVRRVHGKVKVR